MQELEQTLDSREVAEMVDKEHRQLLKDIRRYVVQFNEGKISPVDFFKESAYKDAKGETRPCYCITKKGCEFIAHKLTGQKGTAFTAKYINKFHEMENIVQNPPTIRTKKVSFLQEVKAAEHVVKGMNQEQKIDFYKAIYERHGLRFDIHPEFAIGDLENPHCDRYRKGTIDAIRKIRSERRLRQICTISKRMLEFDTRDE